MLGTGVRVITRIREEEEEEEEQGWCLRVDNMGPLSGEVESERCCRFPLVLQRWMFDWTAALSSNGAWKPTRCFCCSNSYANSASCRLYVSILLWLRKVSERLNCQKGLCGENITLLLFLSSFDVKVQTDFHVSSSVFSSLRLLFFITFLSFWKIFNSYIKVPQSIWFEFFCIFV